MMFNSTTDAPPVPPAPSLDERIHRLEVALGLAPGELVIPDPPPLSWQDQRDAKLASLAGGLRVIAVPSAPVVPGEVAPFPGVTVSVTNADGTAQQLRLLAGQVFEAGPVADQIEATARHLGIGVARIESDEVAR